MAGEFLSQILILLAGSLLVLSLVRRFRLPPILGYLVVGMLLRFGQSAEILAWASTFLILSLSGVFNPIETLPGVLEPLAGILPTTHVFRAAREVLAGQPLDWGDLGIALAGSLVCAALSMTWVIRKLAQFRRRGYVTRYS